MRPGKATRGTAAPSLVRVRVRVGVRVRARVRVRTGVRVRVRVGVGVRVRVRGWGWGCRAYEAEDRGGGADGEDLGEEDNGHHGAEDAR